MSRSLHTLLRDALGEDALSAQTLDAFASLAGLAPLETPPLALRSRLLAAVARPRHAYLHRVAALLDLALDEVKTLLDELDVPALWGTTPTPGVLFRHLDAGPACADAVVGFVQVQAGLRFPHHTHVGPEQVLVLQGGFRDATGAVFLPGDTSPMPAGSDHHFDALPEEDLIYVAVVFDGVDFGPEAGGLIRPS